MPYNPIIVPQRDLSMKANDPIIIPEACWTKVDIWFDMVVHANDSVSFQAADIPDDIAKEFVIQEFIFRTMSDTDREYGNLRVKMINDLVTRINESFEYNNTKTG